MLAWPAVVIDPYEFACDGDLLGVPHFFNVVTNLPFLVVGLLGLARLRRTHDLLGRKAFDWTGLWTSSALLAFASGAYHWTPAPWSLALDRVAICGIIAFVGARAAVVAFGLRPSRVLGLGLLALTEATVLAWWLGATAWIYGALQAVGGVGVIVLFWRAHARGRLAVFPRPMYLFLGFYALAKVLEVLDQPVCDLTGVLGGHPLKHLASAVGLWALLPMMREDLARGAGA